MRDARDDWDVYSRPTQAESIDKPAYFLTAFHFVCCVLQTILDRTGYTLEITSGQRKYGGPPPNYDGPHPAAGQEVSLCVVFVQIPVRCGLPHSCRKC